MQNVDEGLDQETSPSIIPPSLTQDLCSSIAEISQSISPRRENDKKWLRSFDDQQLFWNNTKFEDVFPHTTVARAYSIFRKLGLRHLVVIERDGRVCGMITRKDLMLYKLVDYHQRELELVLGLQRRVREKQARSGFKPKSASIEVSEKTSFV